MDKQGDSVKMEKSMNMKFRAIVTEDLEKLRIWRMKQEVTKYLYTDPKISKTDQKRWYNKIKKDTTCKYWIVHVDGEDVGLVFLYEIDELHKRASWGYWIAEEGARGKGIGRAIELNILNYVFLKLNLNKLCCEVLKENDLVVRIHKKYGSQVEGIRRQHIFKKGEFKDIVEMGILKEDWEKLKDKFEYPKAEVDG